MTPLGRRLLVAAGGIPLLLAAVWMGGRWFQVLVALIGVLAVEETYALFSGASSRVLIWPARAAAILAPLLVAPAQMQWLMLLITVSAMGVFLITLMLGPESGGRAAPAALALLVYPVALLLHFAWLRQQLGWEITLYVLVLLWAGDTAAYAGGRWIGQHKLAPRISPNKTWEGALCALALSLATGWATFVLWRAAPFNLAWLLTTAAVVWLFGMCGDLFESSLKRQAGVKDSSRLLSEHGGVLDRFDSLLFATVPVYYLGLWWS